MKRFTKKLNNDKVVLGKIYKHYVDSFDVDIIYDYQSERAEECGNKFYYGELVEKLAKYENLGTVEEFKNLKERQIEVIADTVFNDADKRVKNLKSNKAKPIEVAPATLNAMVVNLEDLGLPRNVEKQLAKYIKGRKNNGKKSSAKNNK